MELAGGGFLGLWRGQQNLQSELLRVGGADGAVAVLGEGLADDDVSDHGIESVGWGAVLLLDTAAGTRWPAIRADCGGEEEVGTDERLFMPRSEFGGEEDCLETPPPGRFEL